MTLKFTLKNVNTPNQIFYNSRGKYNEDFNSLSKKAKTASENGKAIIFQVKLLASRLTYNSVVR